MALLHLITARKQVEARLLKNKVSAEFANQATPYFLAAVSHDLRQPLATNALYSDMLDTKAPVYLVDLVSRLKGHTENLDGLFRDFLESSTPGRGGPTDAIDYPCGSRFIHQNYGTKTRPCMVSVQHGLPTCRRKTGLDARLISKAIVDEALPTLVITAEANKARMSGMALSGS